VVLEVLFWGLQSSLTSCLVNERINCDLLASEAKDKDEATVETHAKFDGVWSIQSISENLKVEGAGIRKVSVTTISELVYWF